MTRRSLFQWMFGGMTSIFAVKTEDNKKSPNLYHYKAKEGMICRVFLDGREVIFVTEFMGASKPGIEVDGCVKQISERNGKFVRLISKNKDGSPFVEHWKYGKVRWEEL